MIEYRTKTISRLAGVSLRTLQWWAEKNVVRPRIHGRTRLYNDPQRQEVCILAELRRRGIGGCGSVPKFRRVLRAVRQRAAGRRFLLTDGRRCEFLFTEAEVLNRLAKARTGMCLVDLYELGSMKVQDAA